MIRTTDVLLALDHAKLAHLLTNVIHVPLKDMLLIPLEFVLLNAVMDSLLELKLVILETDFLQDAKTVKSNKDIHAQDNHQYVKLLNHLPQLPLLLLLLLLLLLHQLLQQPNLIFINQEVPT